MNQYFTFQYKRIRQNKTEHTLVLFCAGSSFDKVTVAKTLRDFFESNVPPSEFIVIGGKYLSQSFENEFGKIKKGLLTYIPQYLLDDVKVYLFDSAGKLTDLRGKATPSKKVREIFKNGIDFIFRNRGGLITSPSETYHYIFPSKKHSSKFIRAGNTLIDSSEIFFIAASMLDRLRPNIRQIYCDTSSINSLAFALIELKSRLVTEFEQPSIVSFGSYEKFEKFEFYDPDNSFILISASTSGNIIRRLRERNRDLETENISILFYLSSDKEFNQIVVHDLTYDKLLNPNGESLDGIYDTEDDCRLCQKGSYTVKIVGDTFLLDKPKIHQIVLEKKDSPEWLNSFMKQFHSDKEYSLLRCFFGEERFRTLEIYFDVTSLIKSFSGETKKFSSYKSKFNKIVNQFVPARLKAVIYLDDNASKYVAEYIADSHPNDKIQKICSDKNLESSLKKVTNESGAILIVSSNLISGNSLLIVNKLLRSFDNLTITFLVAFSRTQTLSHFNFVKSNLGYGKDFGISTNHFASVEKVFCSDLTDSREKPDRLSWSKELIVMKELYEITENITAYRKSKTYIKERIEILESANDIYTKGLIDNVFLKNPSNRKSLSINKNFAFYDFDDYFKKTSQADIYFTISVILNELRNSQTSSNRITQNEHIRSLLSPENFVRYDDGIIQAAILRAASEDELNYRLDPEMSSKLCSLIFRMIDSIADPTSSEGLMEFLMSIAIRKLRLIDAHINDIVEKIIKESKHNELKLIAYYIKTKILSVKKKNKFKYKNYQ